jgi:hypothetical protein
VVATTLPADDPADPPVQVVSYTATTQDNQTITQQLAMYSGAASAEFASVPFRIEPGTLKFTVNITNADQTQPSGTASQPITMVYGISALIIAPPSANDSAPAASSTATADTSTPLIVVRRYPHALATTYYLPLLITTESLGSAAAAGASSRPKRMVAMVAVFDVALIDGALQAINHSVVVDEASGGVYMLTLVFPPMNSSLFYDPTIGLGLLLGGGGGSKNDGVGSSGGGGGDSTLLMIGMAVGLPLACIALVTVSVTTVVYKRHKRRQSTAQRQEMLANFVKDEDLIPPGPDHRPAYFSRFSVARMSAVAIDMQENSLWDGKSL